MTMRASPVFIVGSVRSGTTMLRLMLDHHPRIGIFGEFEYGFAWADEHGGFPDLATYRRELEQDRVYLRNEHQPHEASDTPALVRLLFEELAERTDKPVVGAAVHSKFHRILDVWPDARFVHIVRDPRDVARSCMQMGWVGTVWHGADFWNEAIARWDRLTERLPKGQCMEVRYEELVRDPRAVLTSICEFVGQEFDEQMLEYHKDTNYEAPDVSLVQQWRKKLSPDQIRQIETKCRALMPRYGYEPVTRPQELTTRERIALHYRHRINRIRFNLDRYGPPLYIAWQVAKRARTAPFSGEILQRVRHVDTMSVRK